MVLGCPRSLNQAGRLVLAADLTVNKYLGTLFVTISAVKYRYLIQTENLHFSHSLAEAEVQVKNLQNVNVLYTFLLLKTMLLSLSFSSPDVTMAHLPDPALEVSSLFTYCLQDKPLALEQTPSDISKSPYHLKGRA